MRTQKRLSREEGGNVMIEFAMLAPVFFMLIMGLVEFVLFQYKSYALNHIVYEATRNLQTGEVQAVTGIVAQRQKFEELCEESAGLLMDCDDIQWDVRKYDRLNQIDFPPVTFDANGLPTNFTFDPGTANQYSVVRASIRHQFVTPFMDRLFRMGPDQPAIVNSFCIVKNEPWT
ncbi:MAG TPA: pilus assembly protein [Hyphomonadaceae bacterium]|nr:pilus assembly protein [Hyphomonadaceae bacterium]HPI48009.1 pilus assembly protein [Hyphomonadaceae bacterium]